MRIASLGIVSLVIGDVPQALEWKEKVTAMTEDELRDLPVDDSKDISHHPILGQASFTGLTGGREVFEGADDFCSSYISNFWAVREPWFVPSLGDIITARKCIDVFIRDDSSAVGLAELIYIVYSPEVEGRVRFPKNAISDIVDFEEKEFAWNFFGQYINWNERLGKLISGAASGIPEDVLAGMSPRNAFFTSMIKRGEGLEHAADFLDHWYFDAIMNDGNPEAVVPFWRLIIDRSVTFDDVNFEFEISKMENIESPKVALKRLIGYHFDVWKKHIGVFISHLSSSTALGRCLPVSAEPLRDLFDFLNAQDPLVTVDMYRCIADSVSNGDISIEGMSNKNFLISVIIHMARVATSVSAFLHVASKH